MKIGDPINAELPNVLILGDSISIGYTRQVLMAQITFTRLTWIARFRRLLLLQIQQRDPRQIGFTLGRNFVRHIHTLPQHPASPLPFRECDLPVAEATVGNEDAIPCLGGECGDFFRLFGF